MSLVLALMVVVFSVVVPRLTGSVSVRRLAYAADEVRTAWAKGRNRAMRSGETYQFVYLPTTRVYTIVPEPATVESQDLFDRATSGLALVDQTEGERGIQDVVLNLARDGIVVGRLPTDVTFLDAATAVRLTPLAQPESAMTDDCYSRVTFRPDGSTSNSTVWLANEDGDAIPVLLRGITGVSAVGEVVTGVSSDLGGDDGG